MAREYIQRFAGIQAGQEDRIIEGQAIVYDTLSVMLNDIEGIVYKEIIYKGAVEQAMLDYQDIILLYNHNEQNTVPLARWNKGKGTMRVLADDSGVRFSAHAKETAQGTEIYEAVKAGDLSGCSFRYWIDKPEDHKFTRQADGSYIHEVWKIGGIRDISIVTSPAYQETSVMARNAEFARMVKEQVEADEKAEAEAKAKQEAQAKAEAERQAKERGEAQRRFEELKKKYLII